MSPAGCGQHRLVSSSSRVSGVRLVEAWDTQGIAARLGHPVCTLCGCWLGRVLSQHLLSHLPILLWRSCCAAWHMGVCTSAAFSGPALTCKESDKGCHEVPDLGLPVQVSCLLPLDCWGSSFCAVPAA